MPHVRRVVDSGSAGVPLDVSGLHGDKRLFFAREGVAEQEMALGDGVRGGCFGGIPWVAVVGARWRVEEVSGSGERHGDGLCSMARWEREDPLERIYGIYLYLLE